MKPPGTPLCQVLTVPGYTGSGPYHWQTLWERAHPEYRRVQQRSWDDPQLEEWVSTLDRAIRTASPAHATTRVVILAHSLGCLATVHWAGRTTDSGPRIGGALLVAPPDVEREDAVPALRRFAPIPIRRLPFPSIVVASSDDPHTGVDRSRQFAQAWGSRFALVGHAGHIASGDGYGPWPEGEGFVEELIGFQYAQDARGARGGGSRGRDRHGPGA